MTALGFVLPDFGAAGPPALVLLVTVFLLVGFLAWMNRDAKHR